MLTKRTKCTPKNPLSTKVDKMYRMYIEVMYIVQNVQTGRHEHSVLQMIKINFTKFYTLELET